MTDHSDRIRQADLDDGVYDDLPWVTAIAYKFLKR